MERNSKLESRGHGEQESTCQGVNTNLIHSECITGDILMLTQQNMTKSSDYWGLFDIIFYPSTIVDLVWEREVRPYS